MSGNRLRRVVTGHDSRGRALFASDGPPPRQQVFRHTPGYSSELVWSTGATQSVPLADDPTPGITSFVPETGGTQFIVVTFPPDSVTADPSFDPAAAGAELQREMPGLAELFEPDAPGMHTTDTVDYAIVLAGEIWLELDDGAVRHLKPHDVVIQTGTRHAWRNRSDAPATVAFILIGAHRARA